MAERWDERYRDERSYRDDRYARGNERGAMERASDEVRSWFGDEAAERRRRMDDLRGDRDGWAPRHGDTAERTRERARDTVRDLTDRDRDGRRGMAEWNDRDRPWSRGADVYPTGSYGPLAGGEIPGDRRFGDTRRYSGADPYASPRRDQRDWAGPNYAGRGPRGYQRTDERIREAVCDALTDDPGIDASDVEVQVRGGEVTLTGGVRTREEKRFTEDIVERVSGVREVNNNLKVRPVDQVLGTARSGAAVLGLENNPPPPSERE
jgi:osmotically-inducible protein OsmY